MSVSFQNNYTQSIVSTKPYSQKKQTAAQAVQSAKTDASKNMRTAEITKGTVPYKEENDKLMHKMQFAPTKVEAMGEFYGSMQTALRESGQRGVMAATRVGNMLDTEEAFEHTLVYANKKDQYTFVPDQIEAMQKKQQEMEEQKAAAEEKEKNEPDKEEAAAETSVRSESDENALRSSANKITSTTGTSSSVNANAQKTAARQYKVNDDPKRNNVVNDIFTGMI